MAVISISGVEPVIYVSISRVSH